MADDPPTTQPTVSLRPEDIQAIVAGLVGSLEAMSTMAQMMSQSLGPIPASLQPPSSEPGTSGLGKLHFVPDKVARIYGCRTTYSYLLPH